MFVSPGCPQGVPRVSPGCPQGVPKGSVQETSKPVVTNAVNQTRLALELIVCIQ